MSDFGHSVAFGTEEELRTLLRRQEVTGRLGLAALIGTEPGRLLAQAAEEVAAALQVEYSEVLELLPDGDRLLLRAGVGWKEGYVGSAVVGSGLESQAGYTLISRGPVIVDNLRIERRFEGPPLLREHGVKGGITVAIRVGGRPYGVLGAHTSREHAFGEDEASFLREVADVLGAAIERKREETDTRSLLGERTRWAVEAERRFAFLSEANARLSASTDPRTVLAAAVRLAVPTLADWCSVDVVEEATATVTRLAVARSGALPSGEPLREISGRYQLSPDASHGTPQVWKTGRPELLPEVDEKTLVEFADQIETLERPASYLCVPLRVGGRTLGAIGFVSFGLGRCYGEEDLRLAEGLAHCTALALDNARHREGEAQLMRKLVELAGEKQEIRAVRSPDVPELTARQAEVLRLLGEGKGVGEIRKELFLSEATVRNHIRALLTALGAHSQLEAVAIARKKGLLSN
ncbi:MAG: GAF domain-containing protein [Rubrobacter sp.]|nr:GAF domain-containing protein [Rubrobacter sp.]